jgi:protein-S-isoprenylcysteine O-methyltransferase Ste14
MFRLGVLRIRERMPVSRASPPSQAPSPARRRAPIATLGRFFPYQITIQPGHQVVTNGPYRHLRHPACTAIALILAGIALACDDIWSLVAATALSGASLAVRIRAEERQLTQALGAEYQHFAAGRKRLVPGVW